MTRTTWAQGIVWLGLVCAPTSVLAQRSNGPRLEGRVEVMAARHATVQAGVGFNAVAGSYVRWGLIGAAGVALRNDETVATWRADAIVRFLLDPFRESRRGLYGLAGVSAMDDGSRDIEPVIFVGVGVEGRAHGAVIPAAELALGGGTRFAVVLRRTRPNRR